MMLPERTQSKTAIVNFLPTAFARRILRSDMAWPLQDFFLHLASMMINKFERSSNLLTHSRSLNYSFISSCHDSTPPLWHEKPNPPPHALIDGNHCVLIASQILSNPRVWKSSIYLSWGYAVGDENLPVSLPSTRRPQSALSSSPSSRSCSLRLTTQMKALIQDHQLVAHWSHLFQESAMSASIYGGNSNFRNA